MVEMQSNRNDDIFGRTDKEFGALSIESLALKYSKAQLQQMAQMGRIPPIYAVMAGMAQDRIQLNNSQAPETTVAQDTFGQQVTDSSGQGITDSSGAAVGTGEPVAPQSTADISRAHGGLMSIPRPGEKYNQDNFATGGIVAFDEGGRVKKEYLTRDPIYAELAEFQAEAEQARGANTRPIFEQPAYRPNREYSQNQGPSGDLPQIMRSPGSTVAAAPPSPVDVETQKQLAKVRPAAPKPAGPLEAMVQQAAPASDEFAQQGMDALKLPKRTPADTTGLVDTPEEIAKNKKDLFYRTVGYTGAEMMAGKSPFAMVNIGEALSKGFSAYAQQIGEHKKATKEDIKDLAAIKRGEAALDQGKYKISADIMNNQLNNKTALEVVEKQIKKDLDVARIGAESRRVDKNTTPYEVYANPNSTPEQKAAALEFASIGKDRRDFSEEQQLNREKFWYETVQHQPEFKGLSAAKMEAARQRWMSGGGGGGGNIKFLGFEK